MERGFNKRNSSNIAVKIVCVGIATCVCEKRNCE